MKAQITFKTDRTSKYTGKKAYLLGFKLEDGSNAKAWLDEGYRNYSRWVDKMTVGAILDNLIVKDGLVDADSFPVVVEIPPMEHTEPPQSVSKQKTPDIPETIEMFNIEPINKPNKKLNKDYWA